MLRGMAKPDHVLLPNKLRIPILYEDRSVFAIDKPTGWMLAPDEWTKTGRNLQLALVSSVQGGDFWAKSRGLKFLKFVHRLDADTTGVTVFVKHQGLIQPYSMLFQERAVRKHYLAVVDGVPESDSWKCELPIGVVSGQKGRMRIDKKDGKEARTDFKLLATHEGRSLVFAEPFTGRTHQIRIHLAADGLKIVGDPIYGDAAPHGRDPGNDYPMALRAIGLAYRDPFQKKPIRIRAPHAAFCEAYGFEEVDLPR